jgi:hypothetical protein
MWVRAGRGVVLVAVATVCEVCGHRTRWRLPAGAVVCEAGRCPECGGHMAVPQEQISSDVAYAAAVWDGPPFS